jgi:uncharacterized protein YndB with AHSA1/START domain
MAKVHQELTFSAAPSKVYRALVDTAEHTKFTGAPADMGSGEGARFTAYGGKVEGRHIELVPNERIVQAWRPATWGPGVYSLVRIALTDDGGKTKLVLDHDGVPEEFVQHIDGGWHKMYWEPLRRWVEA